MGRFGLRAHLRWLPSARRPHGRPARPAKALHGGPRPLPRDLADGGALDVVRDAHRRAASAGRRGGDPLAFRLLDHARHLRGGRRAQQGARHPRRDRRLRGRDRRAPGRRVHRVRRLAVDLLRQHPDRRGRARPRPALRAREQSGRAHQALRRPRRRHRHREPHAPRLRPDAGEPRRLGLGADDPRLQRLGDPDGVLPLEREPLALAASSRSASSSGGRRRART